MHLSLFASFEPATLGPALQQWNQLTSLFTTVDVHGPSTFTWGVSSEPRPGELRAIVANRSGLARAVAAGLLTGPMAASGALVVACPDAHGPVDLAPLRGADLEVVDGEALARTLAEDVLDPEAERLAGVPYTDAFYCALATEVARRAWRRARPEIKVLAVDCDGTLWRGVCAEDGPHGVVLGDEERDLAAFLREQKRAGRLLVLVSKNVPRDVEAVFAERPDLGLTMADVAATRIGWGVKSAALRELKGELGLSLDTFAFLDDNPAECAEVRAAVPAVAVVQRPPVGVRRRLESTWALDLRRATEAGLGERRTRLYQDEARRRASQERAPSFAEYLRSLELRCALDLAAPGDAARVLELSQRVNQFNTRRARPGSADVQRAVDAGSVRIVRASDRFGDYGVSGAAFLREVDGALRVERLLLSCRVLGRGVEEAVIEGLAALARERGAGALEVVLDDTERNLPARAFLERQPFESAAGEDGARVFRVDLARFDGCVRPASFAAPVQDTAPGRADLRSPDWDEVARFTQDPAALLEPLGLARATSARASPDAPDVLDVIAEVLGRRVTASDDLYALGADSLRIVRIVAQLRSRLGVDVPLGEVMHRGRVADLLALTGRHSPTPNGEGAFDHLIASLYDDEEPSAS